MHAKLPKFSKQFLFTYFYLHSLNFVSDSVPICQNSLILNQFVVLDLFVVYQNSVF